MTEEETIKNIERIDEYRKVVMITFDELCNELEIEQDSSDAIEVLKGLIEGAFFKTSHFLFALARKPKYKLDWANELNINQP